MNIYIYDLRRECKFIGLKCISVLHDALYLCVCVHMYAYIILLILYVLHIFIPFQILKKNIKILYFSCVYHIIFELSGILCLAFMLFVTQSCPMLCDPMNCSPQDPLP